ncbi:MAG TPA: hypothetical protein VL485_12425 [Ktedonobacteraceae bacterium]|jgi:hypothetical protein|nr:hypothetical protein [Ktedonobacteraceae bacterium]
MQQEAIRSIIEDENQNVQKRAQDWMNEQAEIELSDAELAHIRGGASFPVNIPGPYNSFRSRAERN